MKVGEGSRENHRLLDGKAELLSKLYLKTPGLGVSAKGRADLSNFCNLKPKLSNVPQHLAVGNEMLVQEVEKQEATPLPGAQVCGD